MDITVRASDGKEFHGTNYDELVKEVNKYEAELKLRKEKEEANRKIREEKRKKLVQYRETRLKEINEVLAKAKVLVDEYEKETGNKLCYTYDYDKEQFGVTETRSSIDFAWNNFFDDFFRAFHRR